MASNLQAMRIKIRRLTRTPSSTMLTDAQIDEYINTFYIFDLPEELRLFALKRTLSFFCAPNKATYGTDSVPELIDFKNNYISIERPVYIAGNIAFYSQSREEFFNLYPMIAFRQQINTGDGTTYNFFGQLSNVPVIQNQVSFVSIANNADGSALVIQDAPVPGDNINGILVDQEGFAAGTINYITGAYDFNFSLNGVNTAPAQGAIVQAQTVAYKASIPTAVLYYGNEFTLRPIPDLPYKITFDAFVRPTAFIDDPTAEPFLQEWWQYLVYGAALKIFQDRSETDSVEYIMPEFQRQEDLILRRTLVQKSTQQVATIYNQSGYPGWWNGFYGNNN